MKTKHRAREAQITNKDKAPREDTEHRIPTKGSALSAFVCDAQKYAPRVPALHPSVTPRGYRYKGAGSFLALGKGPQRVDVAEVRGVLAALADLAA